MSAAALTLRFFRRELSNRFAGSFSGGLWALFQPLLQLAITSFVFVNVFKARVPGADTLGYVPFLATALWPWTAFAEAVLRSTTAIQDNAALIGKVALPREILVLASVGTSFAIHIVGFVVIVLVLAFAGQGIHLAGLLPALLLYLPLAALALGIALISASVQIFVRDLVQALGQLLPLLMFGAPVYYDRAQLPERFRGWLDFNPFTFYAESFRALLLDHGSFNFRHLAIALVIAAAALPIGHRLFRRLDPHFEDFL
ncbi:ABC transporter permease [Dokdonella soli]|uniref:Transport permease protein n=1 Tax=Dokdonella soli TaxID=529810 RepID=A0ABP3TP15_9GAMM